MVWSTRQDRLNVLVHLSLVNIFVWEQGVLQSGGGGGYKRRWGENRERGEAEKREEGGKSSGESFWGKRQLQEVGV